MSGMLKPVEFLRARLDDDQEDVQAGRLRAVPTRGWPDASCVAEPLYSPVVHRLLTEIEAKRQIVRDYESAITSLASTEVGTPGHDRLGGAVNTLRRTICLLMRPYTAHPDFKPEFLS